MPSVLITGANRGIGLGFVCAYAADGWRVHACCRRPSKAAALQAVEGDVTVHKLDVTNDLRVASLARELSDEPLDVLINNAGVYGPKHRFGETDLEAWLEVFQVNTLAPMRVTEAFNKHLKAGDQKAIVIISSIMGSIETNRSGGNTIYRSSKAALNMVARSLSAELAEADIKVITFHPGWVQTAMGGEGATVPVEDSVAGMRGVIAKATQAHSGGFYDHQGGTLPW